jgi:hypothetical protein
MAVLKMLLDSKNEHVFASIRKMLLLVQPVMGKHTKKKYF